MSQQPEALNIAINALQCARHGQCDHAMADEAIAALRAQVERLQAAGQVVAYAMDEQFAHAVGEGAHTGASVWVYKERHPRFANTAIYTTPAQEAADTGADERVAFESVIEQAAGSGALERWPNPKGESYANVRVQDYRQGWIWGIKWARAALAARSGQVAASAMVRMTTKQRADALDAAIFGCPTVAVVAAFSKGITAAEKFHGIGLTVGIQASGRVGK